MRFVKEHKIITIVLILCTIAVYYYLTRPVYLNNKSDRNSKYYINDLYSNEARIYNNYLNENEKKFYDLMFEDVKKHTPTRTFKLSDLNCADFNECSTIIHLIFEVFETEYPEAMDFSTATWQYKDGVIKIRYIYATPIKELEIFGEQYIKRVLNDIRIKTQNMTDEEKVLYVYNYMGDHFKYDKVFTYTSKNQSIYNVFVKKNAVCAGFAKASQVIFQNIGIESYGVVGYSTGYHMWNIIKLKDKYYYFDSTAATSISKSSDYYYMGLDQSYLNSYELYHEDWFPKVETENYAIINGHDVKFVD